MLRAGKGNAAGIDAIKAKADSYAEDLRSTLADYATNKITSLGAITKALNADGIKTPCGGVWHKTSVANLLGRLAA